MIIICPNCNKGFNVKDEYIPESGRLLKCGSCGEEWFFSNFKKEAPVINQESQPSEILSQSKVKNTLTKPNEKLNNTKKEKDKKIEIKNKDTQKFNLLSYTIIILISFIAIIITVDTFKLNVEKIFPGIIPMLDHLYNVLTDIYLFLKDLFI